MISIMIVHMEDARAGARGCQRLRRAHRSHQPMWDSEKESVFLPTNIFEKEGVTQAIGYTSSTEHLWIKRLEPTWYWATKSWCILKYRVQRKRKSALWGVISNVYRESLHNPWCHCQPPARPPLVDKWTTSNKTNRKCSKSSVHCIVGQTIQTQITRTASNLVFAEFVGRYLKPAHDTCSKSIVLGAFCCRHWQLN